jgi:hypothetical protein
MERKCSCHKSCSWEVVILQEGECGELAAKNASQSPQKGQMPRRNIRYPVPLGETNPQISSLEFQAAACQTRRQFGAFVEHGNRAPKVTILLSLLQQTENTLLTLIILSRTLILFYCFSPVSSSTSRRHGRQIFILAHNLLSQVGPSLIFSSFVADEPQWKARSDWYGICKEDPKLCTDSSSQNMP